MKKTHKIKREILAVIIGMVLLLSPLLTSCTNNEVSAITPIPTHTQSATDVSIAEAEYDSDDLQFNFNKSETSTISFSNTKIDYSGTNAVVNGSKITILSSGIYSVSGSISNGQIIIDSQNDGTVFLILNGVDLRCKDSSPIYIINAEKTVISLADGTINQLIDGSEYILTDSEDKEPDAVLFSEDDLTINGSGALNIDAAYKHGINCKDDLIIVSGSITVNSVSDGIRGRDSITIADGSIVINANNDGIQSNNDTDNEKGNILIEGGYINITSGKDGIQAAAEITITGGEINILAGGGTQNIVTPQMMHEYNKTGMFMAEETESTKGIKAGQSLVISGGNVNVDSQDDSLHSNDTINIIAGSVILSTDDDGIHADNNITIDGGEINVLNCNEGIESMVITVNGGELRINASDDGFNAADGTTNVIGMRNAPGMMQGSLNYSLAINGGYIVINSNGDSIDSNGNISMTGGVLIANGPTSNTNGALDSNGQFSMDGGLLIAVSSSGMAESPDEISNQNSLLYLYDTIQPAGSIIYIESKSGEQILAYETSRNFQSIAFSSPELEKGETYNIYSGGSMNSVKTDNLYEKGVYSGGTYIGQFKISGSLTVVGAQSRQSPGGAGGPQIGKRP